MKLNPNLMKQNLAALFVILMAFAILMALGRHQPARPMGYPIEGLLMSDEGLSEFEEVPRGDVEMLRRLGLPETMQKLKAEIRHLIIYLDCHYFFLEDGRVLVMSLGEDGRTPYLVETKVWRGPPHGFRDYRKELLPTS